MASSSLQEWTCSKLTRKCPYQKVKDGQWFFQFDYIPKSWAKQGQKITNSNHKTFTSIGYETFDLCVEGKLVL